MAGDASRRRYFRATDGAKRSLILMDADPATGEDTGPFLQVQAFLAKQGLSVPEIEAADTDGGFILMEDLGEDLYSNVLASTPDLEDAIYARAAEVLAELTHVPGPEDSPIYGADEMAPLGALAATWYARDHSLSKDIVALLHPHLGMPSGQPRWMHRDFHAENLVWLADRPGRRAVGLLDFQDAAMGHPSYDLASLLEDARRDVSPMVQSTTRRHYLALTGFDPDTFGAAYAAQSAQRNLRILGVFARLCLRDGKTRYLDFIPRVWANLQRDLNHPALTDLKSCVSSGLSAPTETHLNELRAACGTIPDPS